MTQFITTFVKRTNLLDYFEHRSELSESESARERYGEERDVKLVITSTIRDDNRIFCRIQCSINPLPVKGEFEVPSSKALQRFLEAHGWKHVATVNTNLLGREMND